MADEPILEAKLGNYVLSWPSLGLMVRLSRLRESHDTISAEVELRPMGPGDALYICRLNLFSTQGKAALARHLQTQVNDLQWATLVEQVAQYTIREYRKGEPVITIGALPMRHGPRWRLQGIIPEGDIALLFGPGGSGKSLFALACAVAVAHGWDGLGLEATAGPVLYCDWEWGHEEHNERLLALEAGMELTFHPQIHYRYYYRQLADDIESVQQIVAEWGIKLLIIDSEVPALGGAKEAKENAEPLFTALRSIQGVSSLIISHTAKGEDKSHTPYGDVFSTNRPRHLLEMKSVSESEDEFSIALYKYKSNMPGSAFRGLFPLGYRIYSDEMGTRIEKQDVSSVPELAERMALRQRIWLLLENQQLKTSEIAEELSAKTRVVAVALQRGKGKSFVRLDPGVRDSRWGRAAQEESL